MGHVPVLPQPPPRRLTADEVEADRLAALKLLYVGGGLGKGWEAHERLEEYVEIVLAGQHPSVLPDDPARVVSRTYPPGHPRRERKVPKRRLRRLCRWLIGLPGRLWAGLGADERMDFPARPPSQFPEPAMQEIGRAPDPPPSDLAGELLAPPRRGDSLRSAVPPPPLPRRPAEPTYTVRP